MYRIQIIPDSLHHLLDLLTWYSKVQLQQQLLLHGMDYLFWDQISTLILQLCEHQSIHVCDIEHVFYTFRCAGGPCKL